MSARAANQRCHGTTIRQQQIDTAPSPTAAPTNTLFGPPALVKASGDAASVNESGVTDG
jgi:hypothetical protein